MLSLVAIIVVLLTAIIVMIIIIREHADLLNKAETQAKAKIRDFDELMEKYHELELELTKKNDALNKAREILK